MFAAVLLWWNGRIFLGIKLFRKLSQTPLIRKICSFFSQLCGPSRNLCRLAIEIDHLISGEKSLVLMSCRPSLNAARRDGCGRNKKVFWLLLSQMRLMFMQLKVGCRICNMTEKHLTLSGDAQPFHWLSRRQSARCITRLLRWQDICRSDWRIITEHKMSSRAI